MGAAHKHALRDYQAPDLWSYGQPWRFPAQGGSQSGPRPIRFRFLARTSCLRFSSYQWVFPQCGSCLIIFRPSFPFQLPPFPYTVLRAGLAHVREHSEISRSHSQSSQAVAVGVGESPPSSSLFEARVCDGGFVNLSSTPEFLPLLTREGETLGGCCHQFLNTTFPSLA